jgi:hypothetical protein
VDKNILFSVLSNNYSILLNDYETEKKELEERLLHLEFPKWVDMIIRPVGQLIADRLGDGYVFTIYGPFGLGCDTTIEFKDESCPENDKFSITFEPGDLNLGTLYIVDYSIYDRVLIPKDADINWLMKWVVSY